MIDGERTVFPEISRAPRRRRSGAVAIASGGSVVAGDALVGLRCRARLVAPSRRASQPCAGTNRCGSAFISFAPAFSKHFRNTPSRRVAPAGTFFNSGSKRTAPRQFCPHAIARSTGRRRLSADANGEHQHDVAVRFAPEVEGFATVELARRSWPASVAGVSHWKRSESS